MRKEMKNKRMRKNKKKWEKKWKTNEWEKMKK